MGSKKIHERKRFGKLKKIRIFLLLPSPLVKWSRQNLALPGENFPFFLVSFFSPKIKKKNILQQRTQKTEEIKTDKNQLIRLMKTLKSPLKSFFVPSKNILLKKQTLVIVSFCLEAENKSTANYTVYLQKHNKNEKKYKNISPYTTFFLYCSTINRS